MPESRKAESKKAETSKADSTKADDRTAPDTAARDRTRPARRAPVRRAPMRRGPQATRGTSRSATASEDTLADEHVAEGDIADGDVTDEPIESGSTGSAETIAAEADEFTDLDLDLDTDDETAADTDSDDDNTAAVVEPDPSEVERTVSYRERRRRRSASGAADGKTGDSGRATASGRVRYRGARGGSRRRALVGALAVVVLIACIVASTLFAVGISRQKDLDDLRAEYANFASQVIVNLTSMNPATVDDALRTVQNDTSGKVKEQLQDSIQQVVTLVRDSKVETKTSVISQAVTKAEPDEGSVIMVFGWRQSSQDGSVPTEVRTFRWRVDMTRMNGDLKMTNFEWVA
ncbi:hypothetical protein QSJ18_07085 [Gordonia sp. ABSL1-1]|uniref:hypothetical protein n=1 Tax=Gordonia sp. ABSL1-1 TaxID=3053923 RepID=UPI00257302CD|nr:hypothetical protein [Gordonia sp. ABSL1-1]MDL9936502.1 hypothetical protein [Gordonia sp. ABSL1-1]